MTVRAVAEWGGKLHVRGVPEPGIASTLSVGR